jgi:hypothetical protein
MFENKVVYDDRSIVQRFSVGVEKEAGFTAIFEHAPWGYSEIRR